MASPFDGEKMIHSNLIFPPRQSAINAAPGPQDRGGVGSARILTGGGQDRSNAALLLPGRFGGVSEVPNANACVPSRTPADLSADMALGGPSHADTINSYPTRAACFADLRDMAADEAARRTDVAMAKAKTAAITLTIGFSPV